MSDIEINKKVLFISDKSPIQDSVKLMSKHNISSILVYDDDDYICGIITERDIVQKFTLVSKDDKLHSTVRTIMSFPVRFLKYSRMNEDLADLVLRAKVRHFPITSEEPAKRKDILGILTVTDLAKLYLSRISTIQPKKTESSNLYYLSEGCGHEKQYINILNNLGFNVLSDKPLDDLVDEAKYSLRPLLVDLDCKSITSNKELFKKIVEYSGTVVYITEKSEVVTKFRTHLKRKNHFAMIKPLDFTLLSVMLSSEKPKVA